MKTCRWRGRGAEKELLDTIAKVTGVPAQAPARVDDSSGPGTEAIPYDDPAPHVEFDGRVFCVIGQFVYGPRSEVEAFITEHGGKLVRTPSEKTRYVVVGSVGAHDWMHSTHGRKIEKALRLRAEGVPIALVAETHWVKFI